MVGNSKVHSREDALDQSLVVFVSVGQVIIPLIYIFTPVFDITDHYLGYLQVIFGTLLYILGIWLFWRSHHDLDSNWSVTLELSRNHKLIKTGVYSYIRHPMYAAFFIMGFGQALLLSNWIAGLSAVISVFALYSIRVPKEEKMMSDTFGREYIEYMQSTGGLIPRIKACNA